LREGGPKFKMTPNRARQARAMYDARQHTVQEIADTFGVSRPTIYRHLGGTARHSPASTALKCEKPIVRCQSAGLGKGGSWGGP